MRITLTLPMPYMIYLSELLQWMFRADDAAVWKPRLSTNLGNIHCNLSDGISEVATEVC